MVKEEDVKELLYVLKELGWDMGFWQCEDLCISELKGTNFHGKFPTDI